MLIVTAHLLLITMLTSGILAGIVEKKHPYAPQLAELTCGIQMQPEHKLSIGLYPKIDQVWGNAWSQAITGEWAIHLGPIEHRQLQ